MKQLRLGIIGMSAGNGHPYSWAAICNGYDHRYMRDCPFPVIPEYLAHESFPDAQIADVAVTHIWTQDTATSTHIAKATHIPTIVSTPEQMIGQIDALLLARDDAELHYHYARPFLEAGIPVYIDKPLALSQAEAEKIFAAARKKSDVFSLSALSHAPELKISAEMKKKIGTIRSISAVTPKYWDTYAVHIIEPVLKMIKWQESYTVVKITDQPHKSLQLLWKSGVITSFTALGDEPSQIRITIIGELGTMTLTFENTFRAFRAALVHFLGTVRGTEQPPEKDFTLKIVSIIEQGRHP